MGDRGKRELDYRSLAINEEINLVSTTRRLSGACKFPYFLVGMGVGAIAGLLLAPRSGEETRKFLRERSTKSLDYRNQQAGKLRESAEGIVKKGKEFIGPHCDSVETATEAQKQAYEEERRENLGG